MGLENAVQQSQVDNPATSDQEWQGLYRAGGVAAVMVLAFIPIQMIVFLLWPLPSTVLEWFRLFQSNALVGLLDLDLLLIVDYALMILLFLALWAALRRANQALMLIALTLELVGVTTYFASTVAFEMLALSNLHATATSEAERAIFLAAGQAMLVTWQGTAFDVSYILSAFALLFVSLAMVRSHTFSRLTAYVGLVASLMMFVPPTAGTMTLYLSLVSLVPTIVWLALVARRLFQLGRS